MLNFVSFFADGSKLNDQLMSLPVYLIRDIENFLKTRDIHKFIWLDMHFFEHEMVKEKEEPTLTRSFCLATFTKLSNMYQNFLDKGKSDEQLKEKITEEALNFRQSLRK